MVVNVVQPNGFRVVDQYAQHAPPLRQVPDRRAGVVVDALIDELGEVVTFAPHAKGAVARVDELDRGVHDGREA